MRRPDRSVNMEMRRRDRSVNIDMRRPDRSVSMDMRRPDRSVNIDMRWPDRSVNQRNRTQKHTHAQILTVLYTPHGILTGATELGHCAEMIRV